MDPTVPSRSKFGGFTSLPFPPILIGKMCTGPVGSRSYPKKELFFSSPETEISSLDLSPPSLSLLLPTVGYFCGREGKKPPFSDASMRRRNGVVATMSTSPASSFFFFSSVCHLCYQLPAHPLPHFLWLPRPEAQKSREESHGKN